MNTCIFYCLRQRMRLFAVQTFEISSIVGVKRRESVMKVICVGMTKTGTISLTEALKVLGYHVASYPEQMYQFTDHWYDVFHGADLDVQRVYGKYDAAIDMPCIVFFEEIIEQYPDAKVILTLRDEDSWVKARVEQWEKNERAVPVLWQYMSPRYRKHKLVDQSCNYVAFGEATNGKNTNILRKRFQIHNDRVRSVVRKENLLEYHVQEGWKPLCEFLNCAIPADVPFPHDNISGNKTKVFLAGLKDALKIDRDICKVQVLFILASGIICAAWIGLALAVY